MTTKTNVDPAQEPSATQRAYLAIRRMILIGELAPGEKLKIEKLRAILAMGGSPIREALTLLVSDLLVERLDQHSPGFPEGPFPPDGIEDLVFPQNWRG